MDGILIVNKPKGITSRDVVNKLCKIFDTKKIGHTGTLDPIAEGVLVVCIGKATKLVEIITANNKKYIATVKLGMLTDTLDITGNVIKKESVNISKEELINVLNSFVGTYNQEVPIYSAVKIKGKKLYEYARENKMVDLPKREVTIKNIDLLDFKSDEYKFMVQVSKGTYIRSLIRDINNKLGVIGVMSDLVRIKQGIYDINNSYTLDEIMEGKYKLLNIKDALNDILKVNIDEDLYNKIKNGALLENKYNYDMVAFIYKENLIAIYQKYEKDSSKIKPYKMFI